MIERIICGEKVINEFDDEQGHHQLKIRVDNQALWMEHWLILNGEEKFIDDTECDWKWVWDRINMNKHPSSVWRDYSPTKGE